MNKFSRIFPNVSNRMIVIGMIHLKALPGSPKSSFSVDQITEIALNEARVYQNHKLDGLMIENMHDVPYTLVPSPETVAIMTKISSEIKREFSTLPLGVQVLATRNKESLAIAAASKCDFVRVENFVYSHIADEGLVHSNAAELLRYRKAINCEHIAIFTDMKKKHSSHSITSDVTIAETAKTAEFFLSDGLIITGTSTGSEVEMEELKSVSCLKLKIPTLIGSGTNPTNVSKMFKSGAKGAIVGSYFKKSGHWENDLDSERIKKFMEVVNDNL